MTVIPAYASSEATVSLTIQGFQIVDLDPNDGQTAGFIWQISDLNYSNAFQINTQAESPTLSQPVYGSGTFSRNQAAAGVAQRQAELLGASATASAYMPTASGNVITLSASGSAAEFFGSPNTGLSGFYAQAQVGSFGWLFLSLNTRITLVGEVTATISGSSDSVNNNNRADAFWGITLGGSNLSWDLQGSIRANSANGAFEQTQTWPISITREYRPNGNPQLHFGAQAYVIGNGAATPVPEPMSLTLLTIGLFALATRVRRYEQKALPLPPASAA